MVLLKFKHTILRRKWKVFLVVGLVWLINSGWGFFGHRQINRHAIFLLPTEMMGFYKYHLEFIEESAVNPDKRRYAVKGEAARHYLDMDRYDGKFLPERWEEAMACYGEDSLDAHGVLPWNLSRTVGALRQAFLTKDPDRILRLSADLGHYVGDAHVPLHTTSNYDGQQTGQHGLHSFWESRLPELYFEKYDLLIGHAAYVPDLSSHIWKIVHRSSSMVDSVVHLEQRLFQVHGNYKYGFETRSGSTVKTVSADYARLYHEVLDGMVERQMRCSIKCVADLWFTAWVDAGQPNLDSLKEVGWSEQVLENRRKEFELWKNRNFLPRVHEDPE